MYDVIVIGAGVVGSATARELSRYKINALVLEKGHDVCAGATKAGGGMIHAGFDPVPGSNKAKYNVEGCKLMYETCDELGVPYMKNGTTVFATDDKSMQELYKLQETAKANKVNVEIITGQKLKEMQPDIGDDVVGILWAPDGGVTDPFEVTYALAENAYVNGVEFIKDAEVTDIIKTDYGFEVKGADFAYQTKLIINCAGGHADVINNMVSEDTYKIIPRYGAHIVIDKKLAGRLNTTLIETPHDLPGGGHTKGMAIIPTMGGTMILGCDATEMIDPDHGAVPQDSLDQVIDYFKVAWKYLPVGKECEEFPVDKIISMFGGCRPHCDRNDFIIGEPADAPGFINAGGIESPGFTSSIAIAKEVVRIACDKLKPEANDKFNPYRKARKPFREMTPGEKKAAIESDPDYAKVVCRCEIVTEAEIRDAIRRPVGARSVAEVKLRTRAGMGRCQGGFCSTRVVEILAEELGVDQSEITQCGGHSLILTAKTGTNL